MAHLISGNSANELWLNAKKLIDTEGKDVDVGNRKTKEVLHVYVELSRPTNKWVYRRIPPLSIGFALAELMWIVNGSQESQIIDFWNPQLKDYAADEGKDFYHGAYGYRLKISHGFEQLERAYQALSCNPNSRQAVLLIWSPKIDFPDNNGNPRSKDIPCNICSLLKIREGRLDWTQIMRSNDLVLGLPYNLVQFTGLQEILAGWLDIKVGTYNHYSDSLHIYDEYKHFKKVDYLHDAETLTNTDTLSISKKDFDRVAEEIFKRMKKMSAQQKPSADELCELATLGSKFEAYNNILFIIGAYGAIRQDLKPLAIDLVKKCTNPVYTNMWNQWIANNPLHK